MKDYNQNKKSNFRKYLWLIPGGIAFVLGTVGTVVPILPTVPFYLMALFCFAKGSQRIHRWFMSTKLYHDHLEMFVNNKTMPMKTKLIVLSSITGLMGLGFFMMKGIPAGRIALFAVWIIHIIYFLFFIKTEECTKKKMTYELVKVRQNDKKTID